MRRLSFPLAVLTLSVPALAQGDDCANATPISGIGSYAYDTTGATSSGVSGDCVNSPGVGRDIWFAWSTPVPGNYRFESCTPGFDSIGQAFATCGNDPLECAAEGFFCATSFADQFSFELYNVPANTTYYLQVKGWQGQAGAGTLDISTGFPLPELGPVSICASAPNSTGQVASLRAFGTNNVVLEQIEVRGENVPPGASGLLFLGTASFNIAVFGDGFLCTTGPFTRFPVRTADTAGTLVEPNIWDTLSSADFSGSSSIHLQFWFRDTAAAGSGFNTSDGKRYFLSTP